MLGATALQTRATGRTRCHRCLVGPRTGREAPVHPGATALARAESAPIRRRDNYFEIGAVSDPPVVCRAELPVEIEAIACSTRMSKIGRACV